MMKILNCLTVFFFAFGVGSVLFPTFVKDNTTSMILSAAAGALSAILCAVFEYQRVIVRDDIIDDLEEDDVHNYLVSDKFREDFQKGVEEETWGKGLPKIYMRIVDGRREIISHWKDGRIEILKVLE